MGTTNNQLCSISWRRDLLGGLLVAVAMFVFWGVHLVAAATLSVVPGTGVYTTGDTVTVNVLLNTAGQSINAADGTLKFNPNELSVIGITKGSIFNLWTVEPTYSNTAGTISFGGGSPSGYSGTAGIIMSVSFRTLGTGSAKLNFNQGSVLAADGRGTNVLTDMNGGTFTVAARSTEPEAEVIEYVPPANTPSAPVVKSSTHPDPDGWYNNNVAELTWLVPSGVTAVRTLLDSSPGTIPTKVYESPINSLTLTDLPEGESYFHLQFKNADGWGAVRHYRLAVDTRKPTSLSIGLSEGADLGNPVQTLAVDVTDETSLVRRFVVQLDGAEPFDYIDETGSSTIILPELQPGYHTVIVEAFDEAGNSIIDTFSFTILAFDRPEFVDYPAQVNEGVIPVFKGLTRADAEVTVSVQSVNGDETQTYTVYSDGSGNFTFIPDGGLTSGVYELVAVAIDERGAQSEPSLPIRVVVKEPGYIAIGSFIVNVLSIFIPLVALVLLLVLGTWYLVLRIGKLRSSVRTESKEALEMLRNEFKSIEQTLQKETENLQQSRKSGRLTAAETELVSKLTTGLQKAKERVEKEVTDVAKLVKNNKR